MFVNLFSLTTANILQRGFGFLFLYLIIISLTKNDYATYSLLIIFTSTIFQLTRFGIDPYYQMRVANAVKKNKIEETLTMFSLNFLISLFFYFVIFLYQYIVIANLGMMDLKKLLVNTITFSGGLSIIGFLLYFNKIENILISYFNYTLVVIMILFVINFDLLRKIKIKTFNFLLVIKNYINSLIFFSYQIVPIIYNFFIIGFIAKVNLEGTANIRVILTILPLMAIFPAAISSIVLSRKLYRKTVIYSLFYFILII